jgi:predicted nucleic acid-binding protein
VAEKRLVLSDSSPLIALAAAGGFGLLRDLFGDISVTAEVRGKVLAGGARPGARELRHGITARWIHLHRVAKDAPVFLKLSAGEASILSAAVAAAGDCYLLLDDEPARRESHAHGIDFTGTLGGSRCCETP